jgi:hypothetical protein
MIITVIKIGAYIAFVYWVVALIAVILQLIDEYKHRKED